MSDNILKDAGERDSLIERAVESVLNTAVVGSARMTGGEVNDTYKIETEDRAFVVKVFKRDWPEEGADFLPLAVPRYAHVAPDSPAAAYGYAVYRYLQGHAMNVNALSQEKRAAAAEVIGAFLRAMHSLQPTGGAPRRSRSRSHPDGE
jgi:Ser/Thr protein kinase RdoA (MazF antagonist)